VTALLALASAVTFGASDFFGGLTARRAPALAATTLSQVAGLLIVVPGLLFVPGTASGGAVVAGAIGGVAGVSGLVIYLRGLAIGPMGVIAPLSALTAAAVPVTAGLVAGERPTLTAVAGIGLGLAAVVLVTGNDLRSALRQGVDGAGPLLALLAGLGFGVFFVALDASPAGSGWWPLLAARLVAVSLLAVALWQRGVGLPRDGRTIALGLATGLLDMAANALFLAATRSGLLSLAALRTSLYPVVVAGLAAGLLRERLDRLQVAGVTACLGAVALITIS
jgi:drug/metabolite transporter (DMT)-like permease